jgi:hypothetical protein
MKSRAYGSMADVKPSVELFVRQVGAALKKQSRRPSIVTE